MKQFKKVWVRILVSLFCGGMINEIVFLLTGDINRSRENEGNGVTLLAAIFCFGVITLLVEMTPKNGDNKLK